MSRFCSSSILKATLLAELGLPFLRPIKLSRTEGAVENLRKISRSIQNFSKSTRFESSFISSFANAGHRHKHTPRSQFPTAFLTSYRPSLSRETNRTKKHRFQAHRYRHTNVSDVRNGVERLGGVSKDELLHLVDDYNGAFTDQLPSIETPRYLFSDDCHDTVFDGPENNWPSPNYTWPADHQTEAIIKELELWLYRKYPRNLDMIYQLYRALPAPRAPYLSAMIRHKMLHVLAIVERKDEHTMLRYLSILDDIKVSAIPLLASEWNSALSFVTNYVQRITETEAEAALEMWREMEQVAGVKGDKATFNILFNVACKAGKFTLAEMMYVEMEARGFGFNRYHHVSTIMYHGLKKHGDGARAAYKNLVEAGEIVDTIVLNAMISALIHAQEPNAAENIYERMKRAYFEQTEPILQPLNLRARRSINSALISATMKAKHDKVKRNELQRNSIIAPDSKTLWILVKHFTSTGDLKKTAQYVGEMKWFNVPVHDGIYGLLFKGFHLHGGIRYTLWTDVRLEMVYKLYMKALRDEEAPLTTSSQTVFWMLKAFAKCSHVRASTVWKEVKDLWHPSESDIDNIMPILKRLEQGIPEADIDSWALRSS